MAPGLQHMMHRWVIVVCLSHCELLILGDKELKHPFQWLSNAKHV